MHSNFLACLSEQGYHRMHYLDWGDPANPHVVICAHGLTRNCRDFDFLAQALAEDCRVVCPDVVGRGASDWLAAKDGYTYPQYLADMTTLIARVTAPHAGGWCARLAARLRRRHGVAAVDWVGSSMGGLIGMMLAAQPGTPIRRLVMNDVGPLIPKDALARIGEYVGRDPRFATPEEAEAYFRKVCAPFGPLTDAQWRHLVEHGTRRGDDGALRLVYDPGIGEPFRNAAYRDIDLWPLYDKVRCPTLLLRGAESDLLLRPTAREMRMRGPHPELVEFAGVGHAPMLMDADQIRPVRDFLLA
jgi:pimeloyl-ACP methyl ester carboxylesterase